MALIQEILIILKKKRGGKEPSKNIFYKNLPMNQMFNDFYDGKLEGIYLMTGTKNVYIANKLTEWMLSSLI